MAAAYVQAEAPQALPEGPALGEPVYSDESALRDAIVSESAARALEDDPLGVIGGALEGGATETRADQTQRLKIPKRGRDIPTGGKPSRLKIGGGAKASSFTQMMLRFEEFGPQRLDPTVQAQQQQLPYPARGDDSAGPFSTNWSGDPVASQQLDTLLSQAAVYPYPTEAANDYTGNPWNSIVSDYVRRPVAGPIEGRPPGEGWSHQRWNEFYPVNAYKTVQAGVRPNTGFRDDLQSHGYAQGEFGPGGLYHTTADGLPGGTTAGIAGMLHPNLPLQKNESLWTFDGTLPPKLLKVRYGEPVLMRHYNGLPIDVSANRGFGMHTITTHEHNGHNPAESDGVASAYFFPGQFYDYRWPIGLAGHDTINTDATDPRAATPCQAGDSLWIKGQLTPCTEGTIQVPGDWRETMSTHWFHDHMLDFTATNVYKGNEAMMNYYSAIDRGNECVNDGVNLRLPSHDCSADGFDHSEGWGYRDYDVNFFLGDKAWDKQGQLWFNVFNKDGFLGDRIVVNWLYEPYFDVRARSYRFRILNGSVSRYFKLALVHERQDRGGEIKGRKKQNVSWDRVPFHLVANDGNILEHAVPFDGSEDLDGDGNRQEHKGTLPMLAIAERYDIVVDLSRFQAGDKLYFVNLASHDNGKKVGDVVPLRQVLRKKYNPKIKKGRWTDGDPVVGKFMELRVHDYQGTDNSINLAEYQVGGKKMIPLKFDRERHDHLSTLAQARHRTYKFGRSSGTDEMPWTIKVDNESAYNADTRRVSSAPQLLTPAQGQQAGFPGDGTAEVWTIETGGGWSHPIHIHFEEGIILRQDGEVPPEWNRWARKDVFRLGSEDDGAREMDLYYNFREFAGTYVEHCHNTQHEDSAMLLRWDLENPGQVKVMPAPIPTWDGVKYTDSVALPTFRSGDGFGLPN